MKLFVARLILVFALVVGTMHAPIAAHTIETSQHVDHGDGAAYEDLADEPGNPASSNDGAAGSVHHHHCPTALDACASAFSFGPVTGKVLLPAHREPNLTSFGQAPPTQPPSA